MEINVSCLDSGYLLMYYKKPADGTYYGTYVKEAILKDSEIVSRVKELIKEYREEKPSE
jgi:hypothetical protein